MDYNYSAILLFYSITGYILLLYLLFYSITGYILLLYYFCEDIDKLPKIKISNYIKSD